MAALACRIEPVAVEADEAEARGGPGEGIGQPSAMLFRKIEIIHRAGDIEIAVRVEPPGEAAALVAQIAFDLEIGIEAEALGTLRPVGAVLQIAPELRSQSLFGQIGDMRRHPRHGEPAVGRFPAVIVAVLPARIGHDRLPPQFVETDVLRRMAAGRGDDEHALGAFGPVRGKAQRLHPAHRPADHCVQPVDPQHVEQRDMRADHVADGDDREAHRIGLPVAGGAGGTGRAHAAADHIGADDMEAVGVDRFAGTDHALPPAGLAGHRMHAGDMLVAGQRMAQQDRIRSIVG